MIVSFDERNLAKHRVSMAEVLEVFASDWSFAELLESNRDGNERMMVIGWTFAGRVLEVGVEHIGESEHVFHARDASKTYVREFERRLRYGG